jgi:predicted site-specific integrase-resolvase
VLGRADLEWRVDDLAQQHSGRAFADAIKEIAADLNGDEKELLQQILLERGATFDKAVMDRVDTRGWFQRQWDKAAGSGGDRESRSSEKP